MADEDEHSKVLSMTRGGGLKCPKFFVELLLEGKDSWDPSDLQKDAVPKDELDEVITLNSVSVIVSEFIPFGANQIVQLNHNLGSTERVQGGFYTALIDEDAATVLARTIL